MAVAALPRRPTHLLAVTSDDPASEPIELVVTEEQVEVLDGLRVDAPVIVDGSSGQLAPGMRVRQAAPEDAGGAAP